MKHKGKKYSLIRESPLRKSARTTVLHGNIPIAEGKTRGIAEKRAKKFIEGGSLVKLKQQEKLMGERSSLYYKCVKRHRGRSRQARITDKAKDAKNTYDSTNVEGMKEWLKDPASSDITSIDSTASHWARPGHEDAYHRWIKKERQKYK